VIRLHRPPCPNPGALANNNYKHPDNKRALIEASSEKCVYCESKITHIDFGDVEHIKPRALFPHLTYDWSNLGYVCGKCNNAKGAKYSAEAPFVDPYVDQPEDYLFAFGWILCHRNGSERGETTVTEIELNRPQLIERRRNRLDAIQRALDAAHRAISPAVKGAALRELQREAEADKEYAYFVRAFLAAHNDNAQQAAAV
jgi:uncharacterized protein (TIGR02646 family)